MDTTKQEYYRNKQLHYQRKTYMLMFEIFIIFGVPAFAVLFVGNYITGEYGVSKMVTVSMLLVTFTLSWFLMYYRYKKILAEVQKFEAEKNAELSKNEIENSL